MTREQANRAREITQNIENIEKILDFLNEGGDITFTDKDMLFPARRTLHSNKLNARLKTVIINTLTAMSKELEYELAEL